MSIIRPLALFCDKYFSCIQENIGMERTDMEFYSFDHSIGFLSFWHVDQWYLKISSYKWQNVQLQSCGSQIIKAPH